MGGRFSKEELYKLRNHIQIRVLIETVLKIPCKEIEGVFRFLCPVCREFQTGVHTKTNLSRCFRCERNFNTIELVMEDQKMKFVESVKFLKRHFGTPENLTVRGDSRLKTSNQGTSLDGCLSLLEQHLVDLATPGQSQFLLGKNA